MMEWFLVVIGTQAITSSFPLEKTASTEYGISTEDSSTVPQPTITLLHLSNGHLTEITLQLEVSKCLDFVIRAVGLIPSTSLKLDLSLSLVGVMMELWLQELVVMGQLSLATSWIVNFHGLISRQF